MQIAIISDSHYDLKTLKKLLTHLERINIFHLIHAGDFITSGVESAFAEHQKIKTYISRGNCDYKGDVFVQIKELPHVYLDDILYFDIQGIRFIVSHIPGTAISYMNSMEVDVVIHGHTHQPRVEHHKQALILNPGSLMDGDGFMVLSIPSLEVDRRFRID